MGQKSDGDEKIVIWCKRVNCAKNMDGVNCAFDTIELDEKGRCTSFKVKQNVGRTVR